MARGEHVSERDYLQIAVKYKDSCKKCFCVAQVYIVATPFSNSLLVNWTKRFNDQDDPVRNLPAVSNFVLSRS